MNEAKQRTVFDDRDQLRQERNRQDEQFKWLEGQLETALGLLGEEHAENVRLCAELEAARAEIADLKAQRNICLAVAKEGQRNDGVLTELVTELELARKVADAAVEFVDVLDSFGKVKYRAYFDKYNPANATLREAVREYRKLKEGENAN